MSYCRNIKTFRLFKITEKPRRRGGGGGAVWHPPPVVRPRVTKTHTHHFAVELCCLIVKVRFLFAMKRSKSYTYTKTADFSHDDVSLSFRHRQMNKSTLFNEGNT